MTQQAPASPAVPLITSDSALRHRPFLQALAQDDPKSADWLAARAGLLLLRYIDAWSTGEWLPVQLLAERSAVAEAICAIPSGDQFRGLLAVLLERTATEWAISPGGEPYALPPSIARVATPLLAYAHALQFSSQWALAADVYLTVWEACGPQSAKQAARPVTDADCAMTAALRLGACYRTLGEADRAGAAYAAALALAQERGDVRTILRARLGEAKLTQERGNLPLADQRMAEIIRDADGSHLQDIRAWAFHDRSTVAVHRERFHEAVQYGFEAWALERDPSERERVLGDLANALLGAGFIDLARSANRLLAATAREPLMRWGVLINLIEIATIDRDMRSFDSLCAQLRSVLLPPRALAAYHFYVGQGETVFGRPLRACTEFKRALAIAEEHGLGEIVIRTEAALARFNEGKRVDQHYHSLPVPPEFAHINDALHGACAAALVEQE